MKQTDQPPGASSGIGRAAAIRLAQDGFKLSITGRKAEELQQTADACVTKGVNKEQVDFVLRILKLIFMISCTFSRALDFLLDQSLILRKNPDFHYIIHIFKLTMMSKNNHNIISVIDQLFTPGMCKHFSRFLKPYTFHAILVLILSFQILITPGDLNNAPFAKKLVDDTISKFGSLYTLVNIEYFILFSSSRFQVNSAGILMAGPVLDTELDVLDKQMDINVRR